MKKNLQGGFAPLLIIAIIAILAVGGGAYVVTKNKEVKKAELEDNVETQANANADAKANANANLGVNTNAKGSLRSLLALGKNTMCTFSSRAGDVSTNGTVYITSDGNMSGDFQLQDPRSKYAHSYMVLKDGYLYSWYANQGVKMNVSATQQATASNTNQSVDLDAQVDYDCENWTLDNSKFTVPTNVNFVDIEAMMKGAGSLPGGVDVNSMMKLKTQ
ncbi:MAG: hypothetical protein KBD52_01100 [Candidatus Pacebacteria bacterium]|nr:hypothetical protein [Candidatus Paceibacterota bacterium]